jgi:ArsR family transcriptional regulator, arsenate/arsenite/antimonite-responsive transcriptional repressor
MAVELELAPKTKRAKGERCCEPVPLFDISQPTLSHHLKKLRDAGLIDSERRGLWAYYYVKPDALVDLARWLR